MLQRVLGGEEVAGPAGHRQRIAGVACVIAGISPEGSIFIPGLQIVVIRVDPGVSRLKLIFTAVDPTAGEFALLIEQSGVQGGSWIFQLSGSPQTVALGEG